jgi:hypothetical protein
MRSDLKLLMLNFNDHCLDNQRRLDEISLVKQKIDSHIGDITPAVNSLSREAATLRLEVSNLHTQLKQISDNAGEAKQIAQKAERNSIIAIVGGMVSGGAVSALKLVGIL